MLNQNLSDFNCQSNYESDSVQLQDPLVILNAICAVSNVPLPVHTRSLAIRLILNNACDSGCVLPLEQLAKLELNCKSTIIRNLKLLVGLNIFTKEEYKDKPCVYYFNPQTDAWLEYTMPSRELRIVNRISTESGIENILAQDGEPLQEVDDLDLARVSENYSPVDYSSDAALEDCASSSSDTKLSVWRGEGSSRHCQIPPIYDQDTGVWLQSQVESTGYTPQKVIVETVKAVKSMRLLFAIATNVYEKLVVGCQDWLIAQQQKQTTKPAKKKKEASLTPQQKQRAAEIDWWTKFRTDRLMIRDWPPYSELSVSICGKYMTYQGDMVYLADIVKRYPNPDKLPLDVTLADIAIEVLPSQQYQSI